MSGNLDPSLLHAPLFDLERGQEGRTAFVHGEERLTYAELRQAALAGGTWLTASGCRPGERIAIALPKGLHAVRAIFAALTAGAAVVPVDPTAPPARIARILADAAPQRLIANRRRAASLAQAGIDVSLPITCLDDTADWQDLVSSVVPAAPARLSAGAPAVLYYTSGTTGDPKAIVLSHANITAFVRWAIAQLGLTEKDRFASHAPLHFDLTTLDLYASVRLGASTVLLDEVAVKFPAKVAQIIEAAGVSVWYSVPTALTLLCDHGALERRDLGRLRLVLFAGEPFPVPALRRLMGTLPGREFVNLYGPTETNVCTYHRLAGPPPADALDIPIGVPCEHLQVEVLREDGTPTGPGEIGEIWVSGPAVMQGYWGNARLTASVRRDGDAASYRTGDFGRRTPDGCIRLAGRRDDQVKLRGHRVELLEVAATLNRHPAVREAAALVTTTEPQRLAAAVALNPGAAANPGDLESHCRRWLPAYAAPEEIRILPSLPRTSTGKLDKQLLTQTLSGITER